MHAPARRPFLSLQPAVPRHSLASRHNPPCEHYVIFFRSENAGLKSWVFPSSSFLPPSKMILTSRDSTHLRIVSEKRSREMKRRVSVWASPFQKRYQKSINNIISPQKGIFEISAQMSLASFFLEASFREADQSICSRRRYTFDGTNLKGKDVIAFRKQK